MKLIFFMIPPNESFLFMIFDNTLLFGFFQRTSNIISLAFLFICLLIQLLFGIGQPLFQKRTNYPVCKGPLVRLTLKPLLAIKHAYIDYKSIFDSEA